MDIKELIEQVIESRAIDIVADRFRENSKAGDDYPTYPDIKIGDHVYLGWVDMPEDEDQFLEWIKDDEGAVVVGKDNDHHLKTVNIYDSSRLWVCARFSRHKVFKTMKEAIMCGIEKDREYHESQLKLFEIMAKYADEME